MPFSIRRLKIRHQFFLVSLPPLFVLLCAIALFFYAYWIEINTDRSTQRTEESIARGESLLRRLTEMHLGLSAYLFTRQSPFLGPYDAAASGLPSDLNALRELESDEPSHAAQVDKTRTEIDRWLAEWVNPTIGKVRRGEAVDVQPAVVEGQGRLDSIRNRILKLLDEDREADVAKRFQAAHVIRRMLLLELGITLLLGGALLFLTWTITHIIADPVKQLIAASEKVSRGDFEISLPSPSDNEFGVLSQSFSRMTAALRQEREEMAALNRFSQAVTQCTTEREVYQHLMHSLKERFEPRQVIIFNLNARENVLETVTTLSPLPEKLRPWPVIEEPQNCKAIRMGTPFLVNDVARAPLCPAEFCPPCEGSYYCRPLIAGANIIGAVRLEGPKDYWTSERLAVLESYLSSAASALSNLHLLDTTKRLAEVDSLTGLYNRRFLEEYARKAIAGARRKDQPVGLILMDIDHFKAANDSFGHEVGDRTLRQFARTITAAMRETNLVARFGGEEFLVLLPDTTAQACMLVAERVRRAVARMVVPSGIDKPLPQTTVSLGIAAYPDHGQTVEEVLQAADRALYESKRAGGNRSTLYVVQVESAT